MDFAYILELWILGLIGAVFMVWYPILLILSERSEGKVRITGLLPLRIVVVIF